ncbi:helicase-related protein [Flavobacteriaceae bacterium]|nr:helicase-related protein [Flavobacteriaceae bacterium]
MDIKTQEFLQRLKDSGHWNDDYDYSEVLYVSLNNKVILIDKKWGSKHLIFPHKLLNNNRKCSLRNCINPDKLLVEKFNNVHNYKYDYSNVKYQGSTSEVTIICKKHGEFRKKINHHLRGMGCNKCSGGIRFTQEDVIDYLKKNNQNNYDFSNVNYKNSKTKIIIIDTEFHSKHLMTFESYKNGVKCSLVNAVNKTNYLIKKFKLIHKNTYDYDKVNYVSENKKVTISCKIHGDFNQTAKSHIFGSGCPKCQGKGFSRNEIINQLKIIHNNKYDYSKIDYKSLNSKVIIICKKHGEFIQKLSNHKRGDGCRKCAGLEINTKEILQKFKAKHGNRYDYSKVEYKSALSKVKIICKEHGVFTSTANNHIYGTGCPTCSRWTQENIIRFINDIRNQDVLTMDPVELNMLIAQGKLPKKLEELVFSSDGAGEHSLKSLKEKLGIDDNTEKNEDELQRISEEIELLTSPENQEINEALMAMEAPSIEELELAAIEERENKNLPSISNSDILVLDKELINTCDDEAVEFFIQYKLKKVWNEVINDRRDANEVKLLKGGKNSTRLRELFLEEYDKVVNYNPPQGYSFEREGKIAPPNMMQKLTVQRIKDYKRYGNWSGTGAGKTISFIIASREVESRLTIVICLNSTVSQLEEDILEVYPDSLVHSKFKKGQKFDRTRYNYLLLNYEKFQQGYTEERFQDLNENNLVDFIVLDEIHNAKQRDKKESLRRAAVMRLIGRSAEMNPNFHLLGMSATPVINNLIEAKSLLQLITGKEYDDISTRGTITNALKVFNQLLLNGIRYIPKYNIVLKELTGKNTENLNIDGESLVESLKSNNSKDYLGLEKILLEPKLESIKKSLKPKTILYTYFTDDNKIPHQIAKFVRSQGYSVGFYIGEQSTEEREVSKDSFVKGSTDILIASRTIGTGVDGLQNVCNRMVLLTLPWTDSEYTQLKGRIYRQGSKFGDVEIIIPQVYVDLDDQRWSWDKQRLQLIRDKRTLADAAVDGIIPSKHIPSREKLCSDSLQALRKWKERVNEGKVTIVAREDLVLPLRPEISEQLRRTLGAFSELNKTWSVSRSENTFTRLKNNNSEWYYYHDEYAKKRKEWDEIPYEQIAKKIQERPDWVIADMGCGENLLSKEIENKVYAFDYVALEGEDVVACDMSNVPLGDQEVDAVVFSLSLMGSNHIDYLKEGFRILKPYGSLFICEPKKKAEARMENLKKEIEDCGFKIIDIKPSSQFIYFNAVKV